jgi:hypothetical protein
VSIVDLVRLERLGPALAQVTSDGRWHSLDATLIAGGKSNLTFEVRSEAGAVILRRPHRVSYCRVLMTWVVRRGSKRR